MDFVWLVGIIWFFGITNGAPVTTEEEAKTFLIKYVYGGPNHPYESMRDMAKPDTVKKALEHFQNYMGLNITGKFDPATLEMMSKSRCGVPDVLSKRDLMRRKRYTITGARWFIRELTYKFVNGSAYTQDLPDADVERIIERALQMWSEVADLTFRRVGSRDDAIIDLKFATGSHGDDNPFDGPSGTLAHAFFPSTHPIGGDAHFDDDETYTDAVNYGVNLLFVALHEFGHSLGLGHSEEQDAIMFPTYLGYRPNLRLHQDDIEGITALYGPRTTPTRQTISTPRTSTPPPSMSTSNSGPNSQPSMSDFCASGLVDAIGELSGKIYVFQGSSYARLTPGHGIDSGYPQMIQDDWPGLFDNVDAVLENTARQSLLIFKDDRMWEYTQAAGGQFVLTSGYPRQINDTIQGLPNSVDMAMRWASNGVSYIFKDDQYYRLNRGLTAVRGTYPRHISGWSLPVQLYSAVFSSSASFRTYFFHESQYIRYDDINMQPGNIGPLETRTMWFGCPGPDLTQTPEMDDDLIPTVKPDVSGSDRMVPGSVWILSLLLYLLG